MTTRGPFVVRGTHKHLSAMFLDADDADKGLRADGIIAACSCRETVRELSNVAAFSS